MLVALPPGTDGPPTAGELASPDLVSPSRLKCLQELREELSCAICLDVCQFPCTTACGHNFCRGCLKSALDVDWQRRCPKCRVPLPHRGQELAVNTTLWNTIQLLFPGQRGAAQPVPGAALEPQHSSQLLPDSTQSRAAAGSAAGEHEARRAASQAQLPPAIARAYTELDDLLAALSLSSSATLARQPPPAVQPARGNAPALRPWARPTSASSAATQPAQPAAEPSARPANPFARSGAAAGAQHGRPGSRSASASSSRNASPDVAMGQRERAHAGDSDGTQVLESTAAALQRAGSPSEEGSQLEWVPPTPPTPGELPPLHSTAPPAPPAPRQQQLSVSLPAGREAEPLGEDGEEDSDITPPAQIVPMHSENPTLPGAPIRRKTALSRLLPSPSPSPTVLAPTAPAAAPTAAPQALGS